MFCNMLFSLKTYLYSLSGGSLMRRSPDLPKTGQVVHGRYLTYI